MNASLGNASQCVSVHLFLWLFVRFAETLSCSAVTVWFLTSNIRGKKMLKNSPYAFFSAITLYKYFLL